MREELERLLEEDTFLVYVPNVCGAVDLIKSTSGEGDDRHIGGFCSTEDMDRQDETVVARGLDFSEFVNHGWFNDNHKQETAAQLGYPTKARLMKNRWWTEGYLLKDYEPAEKVWKLAKALASSGAPRKLGFSIEGKVLERNGEHRIVRAKVRNVAITANPVNTKCTWSLLAKAMASPDEIENGLRKALAAGHGMRISGGDALRPESLEILRKRKKRLSKHEAMERLRAMRPGYSEETLERIVNFAMRNN